MKIAIDFDGVIHWYRPHTRGLGAHVIADEPVPGAIEWLNGLHEAGHEVTIFTCRMNPHCGTVWRAALEWLVSHGLVFAPPITAVKPHADIYIDDRGYRFEGRFPSTAELEALAAHRWQDVSHGAQPDEEGIPSTDPAE